MISNIYKEALSITDDHISMRQLLVLLCVSLLSPAIRVLPARSAAVGGVGGWLSALVALPVLLLLCWMLFQLLERFPPGTGLAEVLEQILGRWPGKALTLAYLLWGLLSLAANLQFYGQRFLSTGYRNAPLWLLLGALLAAVLWIARGPLAAFARAGEIFYLILALTVGAVLLFSLPHMEARNILPLWTGDIPGAVCAAVPALAATGYGVLGAFLAGAVVRKPGNRSRTFRWVAAFCVVLAVLQAVNLGNFGPELTARMKAPFFAMAKGIGVQGGFERVESVVVALWVLSDLAFIGLLVVACCTMCKTLFHLKDTRSAALPIIALGAGGALLLFPDAFSLARFSESVLAGSNLLFGFVMPLAVLAVGQLRRIR